MLKISRDVIFSEKKKPAGMPTHRTGVDNIKNQWNSTKINEKQLERRIGSDWFYVFLIDSNEF